MFLVGDGCFVRLVVYFYFCLAWFGFWFGFAWFDLILCCLVLVLVCFVLVASPSSLPTPPVGEGVPGGVGTSGESYYYCPLVRGGAWDPPCSHPGFQWLVAFL